MIWLPARLITTRSGLASRIFEQIGREVGGVGRHQIVAGELAAIGFHEALGNLQQVMAEGIVGRQRVPLLALDQAVAQQRAADGLHIHRVLRLDVEHVALAVLAAQRVGIAAGVDEERLGALMRPARWSGMRPRKSRR